MYLDLIFQPPSSASNQLYTVIETFCQAPSKSSGGFTEKIIIRMTMMHPTINGSMFITFFSEYSKESHIQFSLAKNLEYVLE